MHKFEYLEIEKSFLDEIKSIFYNFWMDIIWWKNKNLIKIVDTSFKKWCYANGVECKSCEISSKMFLNVIFSFSKRRWTDELVLT